MPRITSSDLYDTFLHYIRVLWDCLISFRLTAFVLKSFAQASDLVYVDPHVVERGIVYILDHQNADGSFNSTGFVHNSNMQVCLLKGLTFYGVYISTLNAQIRTSYMSLFAKNDTNVESFVKANSDCIMYNCT